VLDDGPCRAARQPSSPALPDPAASSISIRRLALEAQRILRPKGRADLAFRGFSASLPAVLQFTDLLDHVLVKRRALARISCAPSRAHAIARSLETWRVADDDHASDGSAGATLPLFHEHSGGGRARRSKSLRDRRVRVFRVQSVHAVHFQRRSNRLGTHLRLHGSGVRRKGRMTERQPRRQELETRYGRPDTALDRARDARCSRSSCRGRSVRRSARISPRRIRAPWHGFGLGPRARHETTPVASRRTPENPLFSVNSRRSADRHSQANHKRRRSRSRSGARVGVSAFVFLVWRNTMKSLSERKRDDPRQGSGSCAPLNVQDVLRGGVSSCVRCPRRLGRLLPAGRSELANPNGAEHFLKYAA